MRIIKPAMVRTGNAPLFDAAVTERSPAVWASIIKQTDASFLIAEQDECFAEDPHELRGILLRQFARDAHGKPIAPQQLARRCARPDAGQSLVLFSCQHSLILRDDIFVPSLN